MAVNHPHSSFHSRFKCISYYAGDIDDCIIFKVMYSMLHIYQVLQDALKRKESEIEAIGKMGDQLIDFSYAPSICGDSIQADVKDIYNQWEKMSLKVQELQNVLRDFLEYWTTFNSELHNVNHVLSENEYWLQRYSTIGADLHALRLQLDKLLVRNFIFMQ